MAIQAKCPDCGAEYNLRDDMRGKTVRCKKCTNTFTVREPEQGRQAPLKPPGEEPEDLSPAKKKADPDAIQPGSRPVKDQGTNAPRSPKRPSRRDHDDDEFDAGGRRDLSRKQKSPVVMILVSAARGVPTISTPRTSSSGRPSAYTL